VQRPNQIVQHHPSSSADASAALLQPGSNLPAPPTGTPPLTPSKRKLRTQASQRVPLTPSPRYKIADLDLPLYSDAEGVAQGSPTKRSRLQARSPYPGMKDNRSPGSQIAIEVRITTRSRPPLLGALSSIAPVAHQDPARGAIDQGPQSMPGKTPRRGRPTKPRGPAATSTPSSKPRGYTGKTALSTKPRGFANDMNGSPTSLGSPDTPTTPGGSSVVPPSRRTTRPSRTIEPSLATADPNLSPLRATLAAISVADHADGRVAGRLRARLSSPPGPSGNRTAWRSRESSPSSIFSPGSRSSSTAQDTPQSSEHDTDSPSSPTRRRRRTLRQKMPRAISPTHRDWPKKAREVLDRAYSINCYCR
jgi:hypothetical protein